MSFNDSVGWVVSVKKGVVMRWGWDGGSWGPLADRWRFSHIIVSILLGWSVSGVGHGGILLILLMLSD